MATTCPTIFGIVNTCGQDLCYSVVRSYTPVVVQGFSPTDDQGYSTPGYSAPYSIPDSNFLLSQKLDSIMSECMEQKQLLNDAKTENKQLKDEMSHLRSEVLELKELMKSGTGNSRSKPKKIPLDLSVS